MKSRNVIQVGNYNRSNNGTQPYQQDRVYDPKGIAPALSAQIAGGGLLIIEYDGQDNSIHNTAESTR